MELFLQQMQPVMQCSHFWKECHIKGKDVSQTHTYATLNTHIYIYIYKIKELYISNIVIHTIKQRYIYIHQRSLMPVVARSGFCYSRVKRPPGNSHYYRQSFITQTERERTRWATLSRLRPREKKTRIAGSSIYSLPLFTQPLE